MEEEEWTTGRRLYFIVSVCHCNGGLFSNDTNF